MALLTITFHGGLPGRSDLNHFGHLGLASGGAHAHLVWAGLAREHLLDRLILHGGDGSVLTAGVWGPGLLWGCFPRTGRH